MDPTGPMWTIWNHETMKISRKTYNNRGIDSCFEYHIVKQFKRGESISDKYDN